MIWRVQNENFILDCTRIFMKAFHLILFYGSLIFPECILIFGRIVFVMIDSTSGQKHIPWLYFISSTSLHKGPSVVMERRTYDKLFAKFPNEQFQQNLSISYFLCSTLCIPLSVEYIKCTEMAIIEFLLFVLIDTLGGMFLCGANNLITIFVAPQCFILCSNLLSRYTKKDLRSNEATMKYLVMGEASSFILVHCFSLLYGSSGERLSFKK
uniref:Uncharacterized protein n=1 Tax=Solanum lycopersicum TaxID=4081 RepID=A0A3Q7EBP6_SOLLC